MANVSNYFDSYTNKIINFNRSNNYSITPKKHNNFLGVIIAYFIPIVLVFFMLNLANNNITHVPSMQKFIYTLFSDFDFDLRIPKIDTNYSSALVRFANGILNVLSLGVFANSFIPFVNLLISVFNFLLYIVMIIVNVLYKIMRLFNYGDYFNDYLIVPYF